MLKFSVRCLVCFLLSLIELLLVDFVDLKLEFSGRWRFWQENFQEKELFVQSAFKLDASVDKNPCNSIFVPFLGNLEAEFYFLEIWIKENNDVKN